jgi:hypothetical protein
LPADLEDAYARAGKDPNLLSMRDDVRVIESLVVESLKAMGEQTPPDWEGALRLSTQLRNDMREGDPEKINATMAALLALMRGGGDRAEAYAKARRESLDLIDRKARTSMLEHRRLQELANSMTAEQAMTFVQALFTAVQMYVADREERNRVIGEVNRLINRKPEGQTPRGAAAPAEESSPFRKSRGSLRQGGGMHIGPGSRPST